MDKTSKLRQETRNQADHHRRNKQPRSMIYHFNHMYDDYANASYDKDGNVISVEIKIKLNANNRDQRIRN